MTHTVTQSAEQLANNVTHLASFPDVAFRINDMLSDEDSGAEEIGAVIEPDPALSAALLKLANSALFGIGGNVSNVARAITVVGLREVRDLAFGICATTTFKGIPNDLVSVEDFWKHSLYCAVAARQIGAAAKVAGGDSLFTAGLLHDIGHLVMFNQCPEESKHALLRSVDDNDGVCVHLSEKEVFGFDHAAVGGALARQWRLPDSLRAPIEYHHEPYAADEVTDSILVVHIANSLAVLTELDSRDYEDAPPIDPRALAALGLAGDTLLDMIGDIRESGEQLIRIFVN